MSNLQGYGSIPYFRDIEEVRKHWGWFLALGILLILLGTAALSSAIWVTVFSVVFWGVLLIGGGIAQSIHAFWARKWSGLFLSLSLGILYIVTGLLFVAKPAASAVSLTLLIGALFVIGGLFRLLTSVILRFDHWGWVFFNGLITLALGLMILSDWPESGLWLIGLFIGVDLILSGWSWVLISLSSRPSSV